MKKLSLLTARISILLLPLLMMVFAPIAQAQTQGWKGVCVGTAMTIVDNNGNSTAVDASTVPTIQGLQCLIGNILSIAITGIGLIGFVMFIVGAFYYMLSGGNAKGTETAKNTITYAIIGLVVALAAFIILNLISAFTGVDTILHFAIPGATSGTPVHTGGNNGGGNNGGGQPACTNCQNGSCSAGFKFDASAVCTGNQICCKVDATCLNFSNQSCKSSCGSGEVTGEGLCASSTDTCCVKFNPNQDCLNISNQTCGTTACSERSQIPGVPGLPGNGICYRSHDGQTCCQNPTPIITKLCGADNPLEACHDQAVLYLYNADGLCAGGGANWQESPNTCGSPQERCCIGQ